MTIIKLIVIIIVCSMFFQSINIGLISSTKARNIDNGEIIIQLSTENPAMNEEMTLYIQVKDYRSFSVSNLPLNITLTSLTIPPNVKNRPFLNDLNPKTDENGTFSAIFYAPIFSFYQDAYYNINVEVILKDGTKLYASREFFVEEKQYDTKNKLNPPLAAPGTWYQVLVYDFDDKSITVSVTQNDVTKTKTYEKDDWISVGESGTINEKSGDSESSCDYFYIGDEFAIIKRFENQYDNYPDNSLLYTFLVSEVHGNNIIITFSGFSNGQQVTKLYETPTKKINQPIIGLTDIYGDWALTTEQPDWPDDDDDVVGTHQNKFGRIYGIGFKEEVKLKIYNETDTVIEQDLIVENNLVYFEWKVPKDLGVGNYILSLEGYDFNNDYHISNITFYVGEEQKPLGIKRVLPISEIVITYLVPITIVIFIILSVTFYSRIKQKKLFNNVIRERIYDYIKFNQGIHFRGLLNALNLNVGTLSHHINVLEEKEYIKSKQDGMYRRFYLFDKKPHSTILLSKIQEKLLTTIKTNPGISQTEISKLLGYSKILINYHIKILCKGGLILLAKEGRKSYCYALNDLSK